MGLPKGFELVLILIAILILFGPRNLPKLGTAIGKATKNLRDGMGAGKKKKAAKEAEDGQEANKSNEPSGEGESVNDEEATEITVEAEELPAAEDSGATASVNGSDGGSSGVSGDSGSSGNSGSDATHKKRVVRVVKKTGTE